MYKIQILNGKTMKVLWSTDIAIQGNTPESKISYKEVLNILGLMVSLVSGWLK